MPQYVLSRNYTLRTTNGVITFVKGEPTWVIPPMERDVVAIGGERVDGEKVDMLEPEKVAKPVITGTEREAQIYAAFDLIVEANESKDFTGAGTPTVKAVEKLTNIDFDRGEIAEAWAKYKEAKAEQQ